MAAGTKAKIELDHSKMRQAVHEGLMMPECYEPLAEHLHKVKAMDVRDDDVLLCSYPKSGTHWMYRVIDMVMRGSTEYFERTADSVFLDVQQLERMAELTSPRVLVTHLPFDRLPDQVKAKRTKIVHVYRNPRAVLVSFYFMMKGAKLETVDKSTLSIEKTVDSFFNNQMPYSGWFGYMDKFLAFQKENPDQPMFNVSYEEMTLNPKETVEKLAKFLGKTVTPEFCTEVVEACSFKKQKEAEESADESQANMKFYRKGDMNDWKNNLTVAVNEKFGQVLKERAATCWVSAKYQES